MMKRLLLLLSVSLCVAAYAAPAPQRDTLRLLSIGNSFSVDGVEQYLWEIADAAGVPVIIGNMYIGGCTLERHWKNAEGNIPDYKYRKIRNGKRVETKPFTLVEALADEPWDYVSFQQQSGRSGQYETYQPYLHQLVQFVLQRVPGKAVMLWYQTWAYAQDSGHKEFPKYNNDQMTMYKAIVAASRRAMRDEKIRRVVPAGTAIQNGRTSSMGDSFNRDGYHLEKTHGRYTVACTWFEALTGISVVGNPWHPETVSPDTALICQKAAHAACRRPWRVTRLK